MKCKFCGVNKDTVAVRDNGIELCNECETMRNSVANEAKVVELPIAEVANEEVKQEAPAEVPVKAEIVIGIKQDGSLYFLGNGEVDLITIEGLLNFGKRKIDQIWDQKNMQAQRAAYEAINGAETSE